MKRITVISVLIIFIAGTFGASFAFAAKTDDSTKKGKSRVESVFEEAGDDSDQNGTDRLDQKKSVLKGTPDTSWFDYKNPKKQYLRYREFRTLTFLTDLAVVTLLLLLLSRFSCV